MTNFTTPSRGAVAAAVLALVLSACGGSGTTANVAHKHSSSGSGQGAGQTAGAPGTTTATSAPTTTASTSATTASTGGAAVSGSVCTAAELTPGFAGSNGATGHVVLVFTLLNRSATGCRTYGYPGVEFLTSSGSPITTNATRTTLDFAGHIAETEITLAPGKEASFRLITSDVAGGAGACVTAHGLQIIAPDDTTPMRVTMPTGISLCNGQATVSPLAPGTAANPA
jgi:hypothetical protein